MELNDDGVEVLTVVTGDQCCLPWDAVKTGRKKPAKVKVACSSTVLFAVFQIVMQYSDYPFVGTEYILI
jgi:hypothetical protein